MYKTYTAVLSCLMLTLLTACGGGGDGAFTSSPDPGVITTPLAEVTLLTSSPQLPSDGALPVTLTALVKDANNNVVPDLTVSFASDSGSISVVQPVTDASGQAIATLTTLGNPMNRTITVTATVSDGTNTLSDTATVAVNGTQLTITGPDNLALGDTGNFQVQLVDAAKKAIPNVTVTLSSSAGNTLSAETLVTDSAGAAQFTLTVSQTGPDTLTALALGIAATHGIAVSSDSFTFVTPAAGTEIPLNADRDVTVRWTQAGVPMINKEVMFSTTRGILTPSTGFTNANGEVTVSITSANAGGANITAKAVGGPSTQRAIEFVAVVADTLEAQADPFTIAPEGQSTITAIVRDPNNNLVKNKQVIFQLDDVTGGNLSVGSAVTDSQGRAQTVYTANTTTSASEGVVITAFVQDSPAVTDSTALTVARREVFFSFGTGNEMSEPDEATYDVPFVIVVTDSDGNAVAGVDVQLSLLSEHYLKGIWVADTLADQWVTETRATCDDEDVNHNGVLDAGEDFNGNLHIEAGNIAAITAGATTNENGTVLVHIVYPQVYGNWLDVSLQVKTTVQGTEFAESLTFILPVIASDVDSLDEAPPGVSVPPDPANGLPAGGLVSPFGYSNDCAIVTAPLPLPPP